MIRFNNKAIKAYILSKWMDISVLEYIYFTINIICYIIKNQLILLILYKTTIKQIIN